MKGSRAGICLLGLTICVGGCDDPPSPGFTGASTTSSTAGSPAPRPGPTTSSTALATGEARVDPADLEHLKLLRAAAAREPKSVEAQLSLARHSMKLSLWDEARSAVDATLALDPDHEDAKRLRRYLPKLRAAKTLRARRQLEMDMAGETLTALGEQLEGAASMDALEKRRALREGALRERFGITDAMLREQIPRQASKLVRLTQALQALPDTSAKEAHVREILKTDHERIDAAIKLLDVLIEDGRFDDAAREVAVFLGAFSGDLELRLYEHHLKALTQTESVERRRAIAMTLSMERLTLVTMISNAKIGKLSGAP